MPCRILEERKRADKTHVALVVDRYLAGGALHDDHLAAANGDPARVVERNGAGHAECRWIDDEQAAAVAGRRIGLGARCRDTRRDEAAQRFPLVAREHEIAALQLHELEHRGRRESRVAGRLGNVDVRAVRRDGANVGILEHRFRHQDRMVLVRDIDDVDRAEIRVADHAVADEGEVPHDRYRRRLQHLAADRRGCDLGF